ncbi:TPA: hypothetical protein MIJ32_004550 [Klebsiella pneumoniae]|nr:hypothetical protein [Klebsiella pneumoniae]HBX7267616.1 hypothetical protein [Klebsiella pneumoniae]HBX7327095.1 hypothetical protein [Klebsiella pneumoniae]HBX7379443.1 hypothetical protein [Klebsiella pneumoniae]HBX7430921.1 hypothetical protein [Klebsiella pneumoniae]
MKNPFTFLTVHKYHWKLFFSLGVNGMSLIERDEPDNHEGGVVLSSSRDMDIKLKMYQEAYHSITGKTEKISFKSSADLLIDVDELNQIHHKISQLCDVHHIIARSESITIYHTKERKENFTSFERFKIYNTSITSPTLTVLMEYNFSILPAGSVNPQQYKVAIRLNSRVSLMKQMRDEAPAFMRGRLLGFMYGPTADISVEYADYVVARSFVQAMQEWVDGCKKSDSKLKALELMQSVSHYIPGVVSFLNGIILTYFFIKNVPVVLNLNSSYLEVIQYGFLFFASFMLTSKIATFLGSGIETSIDRYTPLSYLLLNKGDERVIDNYKSEKSRDIFRFMFSSVLTITLGITSSLIANFFS